MPTMIENMKEIAKQKLLGIGAAMAVPGAIVTDVAKNTAKAIPNLALGAIGAMTGLEAPKKAYGWGATNDVRSIQSEIANNENMAKEGLRKNVREGLKGVGFKEPVPTSNLGAVNQPLISMVKGEGLGAMSKSNPSVTTPTASTAINAPATNPTTTEITPPAGAISRPEGDPNFFKGGATFQPTGATPSTGMSEKDLEDWKARGALANSRYSDGKNPNDSKLSDMMEELVKTASSGSPSIERATKLNALKLGIQTLAPQTSYGAFGVAGLQTDATKRGQDINAETTRRGQDLDTESKNITARLNADKNLIDSFYKSGLLEQGKEELGIKRMTAEAKDPQSFLKLAIQASPKIKTIDANGAETETHDVQAGIKMLTDSGFETPKGFKMPASVARPSLTPEQAKAELERRKALKK